MTLRVQQCEVLNPIGCPYIAYVNIQPPERAKLLKCSQNLSLKTYTSRAANHVQIVHNEQFNLLHIRAILPTSRNVVPAFCRCNDNIGSFEQFDIHGIFTSQQNNHFFQGCSNSLEPIKI